MGSGYGLGNGVGIGMGNGVVDEGVGGGVVGEGRGRGRGGGGPGFRRIVSCCLLFGCGRWWIFFERSNPGRGAARGGGGGGVEKWKWVGSLCLRRSERDGVLVFVREGGGDECSPFAEVVPYRSMFPPSPPPFPSPTQAWSDSEDQVLLDLIDGEYPHHFHFHFLPPPPPPRSDPNDQTKRETTPPSLVFFFFFFFRAVIDLCRRELWHAVKTDDRLVYRGANGIRTRTQVLVSEWGET